MYLAQEATPNKERVGLIWSIVNQTLLTLCIVLTLLAVLG
jgi:hypothetical protein